MASPGINCPVDDQRSAAVVGWGAEVTGGRGAWVVIGACILQWNRSTLRALPQLTTLGGRSRRA